MLASAFQQPFAAGRNFDLQWEQAVCVLLNLTHVVQDERTVDTLDSVLCCMVITNPLQTGHPVMFATKAFAEMVGYHREDLLGRSVFQVTHKPLSAACVNLNNCAIVSLQ